jgi:hypothetical protein
VKVLTAAEVMQDAEARGLRRVLIVTALPIEMKAVRAHLTELGSCPARDGNVYECGQFSGQGDEWLVVVAESGAGTHTCLLSKEQRRNAIKLGDETGEPHVLLTTNLSRAPSRGAQACR